MYPQGKNSTSSYRPKSLFYHYQVAGIDSDTYKIDSVNFVLVIGKFNTKSNPLPTIKVFYGDNNAPYKKNPIAKVSSYTSLKNKYDFDSHTLQFTIKGVTISQLKNIIIEVDWGKTKITGASTISVNRARLSVDYSKKNPKFSLYQSLSKTYATTNDSVPWKLTVKNTGQSGSGSVDLVLPKGVSVSSSSGGGSYNASIKKWSFNNLGKDKSVTRTFYLKSRTGAGIGGTGVSFGDATPYRAKVSDTGAITIGKDAIISAESEWAAGIGTGCDHGYTQSITVSRFATISASSTHGETIGRGVSGTVGSTNLAWDDSSIDEEPSWALEKYYTPLVIHHGTKANQATNIFIKDMRSASLGLDNVNVLTRDESSLALFTLDVAINYALDNQTRMGAYQSRLDYTVSNLTTSNENTQSSESTIRDANMAKEMTEYTKANVLAQSAQAMLAQANQNASSVLELLQ